MQLRRFSEAAGRARQRDMQDQALSRRMAAQADKDTFGNYMKTLDG